MTTSCARRQLSGKTLGQAVFGCFALVVLAAGCNQAPPLDLKAAEDAIRAGAAAQLKAAQALDASSVVTAYSADATLMPPNEPSASDPASILKAWQGMLVPGTQVNWSSSKIEVAASGDIAYDQGTYAVSTPGPDGKPINDKGKYLAVSKKQADGSWKLVEDIWNSDLPAVAPAAPMKKKGK